MAPTHGMDPSAPRDTLTLKCPCGYIKRDVMCIGDAVDREQKTSSRLSFTCPFCALESIVLLSKPIRGQAIPIWPRSKNPDRPLI
ncbi:hypothetical protein PENTCL1PPCAC_27386 [Pristionchus entomophagus]|uniref:Uncharacterized protein n=1 Tax=Pristionchus entomophagus TaxID=358040 RepID=A0AAV5UEB1_9BILA|nr:hypothetical protein PENTCL1PPCAC_27386 [Pristionchus entomophagus]